MSTAKNTKGPEGVVLTLGACVEIQTRDLTGGLLDWAMAQAQGVAVHFSTNGTCWFDDKPNQCYTPHSRYRQSGQLLDDYDVQVLTTPTCGRVAFLNGSDLSASGPDTLTAMCRLIVLHKLGETVRVPAKLVEIYLRNAEKQAEAV